ncbi:MAG: MopE-related protein [Bradymonadia bacterium]
MRCPLIPLVALSLLAWGCTAQFPEASGLDGGLDENDGSPISTDGTFLVDEGPEDAAHDGAVLQPDSEMLEDAELADMSPADAACVPQEELCNDLDDDCDDEIDEGLGLDTPCQVGIGLCTRRGQLSCQVDESGAPVIRCDVEPGTPEDEQCNDLDDDCDGQTDETFLDLDTACVEGLGECRASGIWRCNAAGGLMCTANPAPPIEEQCDGADNDCDGDVDEDLGLGDLCTLGIGQCVAEGQLICGDNAVLCNAEPLQPSPEQCNGLDDDCDAEIDEAFPALGGECAVGLGFCRQLGTWQCDEDGEVSCDAVPGRPATESCNSIDDDCDGAADEGLGVGLTCEVGIGICLNRGTAVCDPLGMVTCNAEPLLPELELCNDLDDDCDGITDEDFLDLDRPCSLGIGACTAQGLWRCGEAGDLLCDATPGQPAPETCNGIDEDCDGLTDEGLGLGQVCAVGIGQCNRAGITTCGEAGDVVCGVEPGEPIPELCNGIDDDCDGQVDELFPALNNPCLLGIGACRSQGTWRCDPQGGLTCDATPGEPEDEICNDVDDDCDGLTDEDLNLGQLCQVGIGLCIRQGINICGPNDDVICSTLPGLPREELCNGADDDCDGASDEDIPGLGEACTVGQGACERAGVNICDFANGVTCGAEAGEPDDELCNGIDDDCDGHVDEERVCGPYIARQCRVWLGQADNDEGPESPSATFGDCMEDDFDDGGNTRCTSTRGDSRFRVLDIDGDVNENDSLGIAFTCDDQVRPELSAWIESRCKIYLGHADINLGPNNTVDWGPCPAADEGVVDQKRCVSSGGDRQFRTMQLVGDVNQDDDLGIAFICTDPADPDRAASMAESAAVFIAWAANQDDVTDGGETWSECPAEVRDISGNERCVSSRGDSLFHRLDLGRDVKADDAFGIGLFSR